MNPKTFYVRVITPYICITEVRGVHLVIERLVNVGGLEVKKFDISLNKRRKQT